MSQLGRTRTSSDLDVMSAVLLITNSTRTSFNVAQGPIGDIRLFDHLVGGGEQRLRHGEVERLRGLEIDQKLELGPRTFRFMRPVVRCGWD